MSRVRVEIVFDGPADHVRDVANAMQAGLRRAQQAGRFDGVTLVQGPTLSQTFPVTPLSVADYLARSDAR